MRIAVLAAILSLNASPVFAGAADEMLEADRAFAAMAAIEGVPAAFAAYADPEVRMFPAGGEPYHGLDKLVEQFAGWPENATLEWSPVEGFAAKSGDFGFTWGRYVYSAPGEDGDMTASHGKYVSIWRKDTDGAWKFIADIGNSNPPPESEQP